MGKRMEQLVSEFRVALRTEFFRIRRLYFDRLACRLVERKTQLAGFHSAVLATRSPHPSR